MSQTVHDVVDHCYRYADRLERAMKARVMSTIHLTDQDYGEVRIRLWIYGLDCPRHYRLEGSDEVQGSISVLVEPTSNLGRNTKTKKK